MKMKIMTAIVSMVVFLLLSGVVKPTDSNNNYKDVNTHAYFYPAVVWADTHGVTNGTGDNMFSPEVMCSRSQVVTFLWRMNECPIITTDHTFTDIEKDSWYYNAVLWAVDMGITNGYGQTDKFAPDVLCTRAEIVTFLWRSVGSPQVELDKNPFNDIDVESYYYIPMLWAYEHGITLGVGNGEFTPNQTCTRGEVVTFLWRTFLNETGAAVYNASEYNLSPTNNPIDNSYILQALVDALPNGSTIYIPSGEYCFGSLDNLYLGSRCIKMRSNISIKGVGDTVLMPVGETEGGLNMFYFNDLIDIGEPNYLENCNFENFIIDSYNTSARTYTSAGKGFMFNLYKNCHWDSVIVKNTDGTGFGMDCPINCSITNCVAINCGKAATRDDGGASGFGIGFGYADNENIIITDCYATGNMKFGFFFEHQGIFNPELYEATTSGNFIVSDCSSDNNCYNFGGISAMNVTYKGCVSKNHIKESFYFENSINCKIIECHEQ